MPTKLQIIFEIMKVDKKNYWRVVIKSSRFLDTSVKLVKPNTHWLRQNRRIELTLNLFPYPKPNEQSKAFRGQFYRYSRKNV